MKKLFTFIMILLAGMQSAYALNVDAFMYKHIAPVSDAVAKIIFFPISIFAVVKSSFNYILDIICRNIFYIIFQRNMHMGV